MQSLFLALECAGSTATCLSAREKGGTGDEASEHPHSKEMDQTIYTYINTVHGLIKNLVTACDHIPCVMMCVDV